MAKNKNDRNVKDHSVKQGSSNDKLDTSGHVKTVTIAFSKCWNWYNLPSVILRSSMECFQNYVLNYYSFTFKCNFLKTSFYGLIRGFAFPQNWLQTSY